MKKKLWCCFPLRAGSITAIVSIFAGETQAQLSYTLDSSSFSAITLDGGMTQARFADLNQNGHLDMVCVGDHGSPNIGTNQHGITVFFGNGTGTGWNLYQNGSFGYGGCAVGDLNNDGKQDIAYSMHHNYGGPGGGKLIEAQLGNGTGKSWTPYDTGLAVNGESYGMFGTDLGDINNDGLLDIASNSFGLGPGIHIYKNNGNASWTQTYTYGYSGTTGHYIQCGDMDGDGNLDFAASNELGSTYFGNGNGGFTLKKIGLPPLPTSNQDNYLDVSLGDIDNDGDDDLAFVYNVYSGIRGVYVYKWNKITQQWDNSSMGLPNNTYDNYLTARLADMDMDGYLDLIIGSSNNSTLEIWKGNGGTSWTQMYSQPFPNIVQIQDLAIADVDHNGYPDILIWAKFNLGGFFPTYINKIKFLRNNSVPTEITAALTYPTGWECMKNNSVKFIHWVSAVQNNNSSSVKIEYSVSGISGPWTVIAALAPNNGTYQWTVPASVNSMNCYIRITATDNVSSATATAMNTNSFSIGTCNSAVGISETNAENLFSIFPNPMSEEAIVYSKMKNLSLKIVDVTGKIVRNVSDVNQFPFTIERGNLAMGIYILELRSENKIERSKLIIN